MQTRRRMTAAVAATKVRARQTAEITLAAASLEIGGERLEWLLEPANPGVRMRTLTDLLDRPANDPDVVSAAAAINESPPVSAILEAQESGGNWGKEKSFYTGKYRSTVWTLLVLAELGADGSDRRIRRACEFILENSLHRDSGGFSQRGGKAGGQASGVIPCLTGNMLWVLIRFGFLEDPRVRSTTDWVTTYQRYDDGDGEAPTGWPYDNWEICWGRHTCHMGVVKSLKAFAEIPVEARSPSIRKTIERAAEFLLIHHIFKRSHDLKRVSKPGWRKFGFPLMYQTDALEILNLLLDLGYRDNRMRETVELVRSKQTDNGRWLLENTYNPSQLVPIEEKGEPSKWITLNALKALKRAEGLS
jgi:hypothetical protein